MNEKRLSVREKTAYGIGAVGKDMVYAFVSGFLMYYYNTVLGISASFIGVLFMAARVFDAINDPCMGIVVEKTHTRFGKFRPWLFLGTLLNGLILYAMFAVPQGLTGHLLLIYTSILYILWGVTYTVMDIPYWSMIPAITESGKDREQISVIARSCAGVGFAIPTALTMAVVPLLGSGNMRTGFKLFASIISIFFIAAIIITVTGVKERNTVNQKSVSITEMLTSLFQNDQALIVVVSIIIFNASLYLTQQLAIYFFQYDIGNASLYGIFGTIGGGAQILSMLSLPILRKKFECKKILTIAISITLVGYVFLFLLGSFGITNIVLLCIAAIIIFIGFGLATVLTTIFLADTVDYGEYKNGSRNESVIFSLQTFVVKLASAISVLIAGVGLDVIGLDQNATVQKTSTLFGLRFMMTIIPMIGLILCILFFIKKYKLDDAKLNEIKAHLANKNNQQVQKEIS